MIDSYGPIPSLDGIRAEALAARLRSDKKTLQGKVHFVLPDHIGSVRIVTGVPERAVIAATERALTAAPDRAMA